MKDVSRSISDTVAVDPPGSEGLQGIFEAVIAAGVPAPSISALLVSPGHPPLALTTTPLALVLPDLRLERAQRTRFGASRWMCRSQVGIRASLLSTLVYGFGKVGGIEWWHRCVETQREVEVYVRY